MLRSGWPPVVLLAVAAGALRLPFAGRPLSPDEAGLLIVAAQWGPGISLYGDHFVDRPPLLVTLFALAEGLGGTAWAVRGLGIAAAVGTVLAGAALARAAAPGRSLLPPLTAAVLVSTPLLDGTVASHEVLGLPFVLGGCAAAVLAVRSGDRARVWAVAAGAAGAGAVLVKQSSLDVFVFAAVLLLVRRRAALLLPVALGAAAAGLAVLAPAALLGTGPAELVHGVVGFRAEASSVIAGSSTEATPRRLGRLTLALVATGIPLVVVALARAVRGPAESGRPDLRWAAWSVLAWESVVVLAGGSYWLHYLMVLVPGVVLLAAAATQRRPARLRPIGASYAVAATSTVVACGWVLIHPLDRPGTEVAAWLEPRVRDGDTAVVAFGDANILHDCGLTSPYPHLWSLPVRVRDPDLDELRALLAGPDRPTWVLVKGRSLATWGVDATAADRLLRQRYDEAAAIDGYTVYRLETTVRTA